MKTRPDEPLRYVELARQGARIERSLTGDDLPRWAQVVAGDWHVRAVLEFYRDEQGLSWVSGDYDVSAVLLCNRCAETLTHAFAARASMCIVAGDAQARELAGVCDVLVAQGDSVLLVDLVEDELLLAVPEWLCTSDPCERMLPLDYPAVDDAQLAQAEEQAEAGRNNPFAVLAALKK